MIGVPMVKAVFMAKYKINYKEQVNELQITCKQIASCLPNTTFTQTSSGGFFVNNKNQRRLGTVVNFKTDSKRNDSFKINRFKNVFGLNVNYKNVKDYTSICESVIKGLGIKK